MKNLPISKPKIPNKEKKGSAIGSVPPKKLNTPLSEISSEPRKKSKQPQPFKYRSDCNEKRVVKTRCANANALSKPKSVKTKSPEIKPLRYKFDLSNTLMPVLTAPAGPNSVIQNQIIPDVGGWWFAKKRDMELEVQRRKKRDSSTLWDIISPSAQKMATKNAMNRTFREELYQMKWASSIMVRMGYDPHRVYNWGERGSGLHPYSQMQDFYKLRDEHIKSGLYFVDPFFPANRRSLSYSGLTYKVDRWRRPMELCKNPKLFVDGVSRFDVVQGALGDCWLISAMATLTLNHKLLAQVVPLDQAFDEKYSGIFHFRFWQYGRWVDVVVDDLLPISENGQLVFARSEAKNEYWSCLLEKAYAKLYGSYEAIDGGTSVEAMSDLTGGLCENFTDEDYPEDMFKIMLASFQLGSIMCVAKRPNVDVKDEVTPSGLVKGHAYSITKIYETEQKISNGRKEQLIRLMNPWGKVEWKGSWRDDAPDWKLLSKAEKQKMGVLFQEDGEFWMCYDDLVDQFHYFDFCHICPDPMNEGRKWEVSLYEGEWVKRITAGGTVNNRTFQANPQYFIDVEPDKESTTGDSSSLIISLMQKNRRKSRHLGHAAHSIGFFLYHILNIKYTPKPLTRKYFKLHGWVGKAPCFKNIREVIVRFTLIPGSYCIIPCTFDEGLEADFLIRIYSECKSNLKEYDQDIDIVETQKKEVNPPVQSNLGLRISKIFLPNTRQGSITNIETDNADMAAFQKHFDELAQGSEEINWVGVQNLLQWTMHDCQLYEGLSKDVCRSFVALLDKDHSGKLSFNECIDLYSNARYWTLTFAKYTDAGTQIIGGFKLRDAFNDAGITVNAHLLNMIMYRYGKDGGLSFDHFLSCIIRLRHLIEIYKRKLDPTNDESKFTKEQFIEATIYS